MKKGRFWFTTIYILLAAALLLPGCTTLPEQTTPKNTCEIHYIQRDPYAYAPWISEGSRETLEEELSREQLSWILPEQLPAGMTASGYTVFNWVTGIDYPGVTVHLSLDTGVPKRPVWLTANMGEPYRETGIREVEPASSFNGVPFRLFEYPGMNERTQLTAFTILGDFYCTFSLSAPNEEVEQAKAVFEETLMCFSYGGKPETPNWRAIQPRYSGEYFMKEVTWEEAQKDSWYGSLIPKSVPEGYALEWGTRARRHGADDLRLTWKRKSETVEWVGADIVWECERYDRYWDSEEMRFPEDFGSHEEERVIYEIEQLTQPCRHWYLDYISSGLKHTFGVKTGDTILWIKSAGETQWVKEQLYAICGVVPIDPWECESWNGPDEEYYQDAEFGAYLPRQRDWMHSPSFLRHQSKTENCLSGQYTSLEDDGYIDWHISYAEASATDRIVDIEAEETYSLSGYSNPWDYMIPEENRDTMRCPVFLAEEVTLETVSSRVYYTVEEPDIMRMQFDVQYDDVVVSIHAVGATPERVYELIDGVRTGAAEIPESKS